ncbi:bifunctional adenosylcobinamide kinase/adenosylcobinamide-phosphate guanylyltransferase [Trichothermofontia sichuanensis B231]|uniref:bifunctional adenosylcobinamide kinase/adenosylcobinamide-phosphate guanylyltransferase n=1 Tax=Trichothermofontia sichuanensis TaxID=3045816 RepID=UPI00224573DE|nr:bifunctional adenosylcobinamide kinase/adenosylcobinamide-phosphate guanylyltransferase [Trichothermofontia sichuanensis]UZQ53835.1 bifunctional adenosylcobinamide kinase/adenosylcobinamide-phosphate guanylyltransferase [Trichothermofontia sichuanensis B231]
MALQRNVHLTLVLGPARSGKSEWAEALAQRSGQPVTYIATAIVTADDPDWQARIQQHRRRRPPDWRIQEVPIELAQAIAQAPANTCLLVDSLGTWLANLLTQGGESWEDSESQLLSSLEAAHAHVILVAEEVGWGVIPAYPQGRQFRDRLGHLVRQVGAIAGCVYLVTGGYALNLSQLGVAIPHPLAPPGKPFDSVK